METTRQNVAADAFECRVVFRAAEIVAVILTVAAASLVGKSLACGASASGTPACENYSECVVLCMNSSGAVFFDGKPFDTAYARTILKGRGATGRIGAVVIQIENATPLPAVSIVVERFKLCGADDVRISVGR